jgi:hypothetical protein
MAFNSNISPGCKLLEIKIGLLAHCCPAFENGASNAFTLPEKLIVEAFAACGAIIAENKIAEHKTRPLITNIFKNVFIDF